MYYVVTDELSVNPICNKKEKLPIVLKKETATIHIKITRNVPTTVLS